MRCLGVEIEDLQGLGLVTQFLQAQDIAVHGGRIAGYVDYASGHS